jgi:hypothetical protein
MMYRMPSTIALLSLRMASNTSVFCASRDKCKMLKCKDLRSNNCLSCGDSDSARTVCIIRTTLLAAISACYGVDPSGCNLQPLFYEPHASARCFVKLCSSSGVLKRPHSTHLGDHNAYDGFATLANAFESRRNLPLRALKVHILGISINIREDPHGCFVRSLQAQSNQQRPNRVTLLDTCCESHETWPTLMPSLPSHAPSIQQSKRIPIMRIRKDEIAARPRLEALRYGSIVESIANLRLTLDAIGIGCGTCSQCMNNVLSTSSHAHTQLNRCYTRASVGTELKGTKGTETQPHLTHGNGYHTALAFPYRDQPAGQYRMKWLHMITENSVQQHQHMIKFRMAITGISFQVLRFQPTGARSRAAYKMLDDILENLVVSRRGRASGGGTLGGLKWGCMSASCCRLVGLMGASGLASERRAALLMLPSFKF